MVRVVHVFEQRADVQQAMRRVEMELHPVHVRDSLQRVAQDHRADITAAEPPRGAGGRRVGEPLAAQPQQPDAPYAVDDGAGERAAALPRDP